ncbi:hypothetical protein ACFW1A_23875 [Kitasatospora sp. NPDC058965]|uniref:hypothetical protein n=1 Tax=Kitasatospora sp. NPDC058965 TaxID=3346682 RepID=UPI00369A42E1
MNPTATHGAPAPNRTATPGTLSIQPVADLTPGARWLLRGQPASCAGAWHEPHGLAPIRLAPNLGWEAIGVHPQLGEPALRTLDSPGPVLSTVTWTFFLVPVLTHPWSVLLTGIAETPKGPWNWGRGLTVHLQSDGTHQLLCPRPGVPHGSTPNWLVEPDGSDRLTFTGELAKALHEVSGPALTAFQVAAGTRRPTTERPHDVAAFFGRRQHSTEAT